MRRVLAGVLGVGLLVGFGLGVHLVSSAPAGETCQSDTDCRGAVWGGAGCMYDAGTYYCAPTCETPTDCPEGWACEEVGVSMNGIQTNQVARSCVRPHRVM